jgi:DNA polymerase-1
MSHLLIIDGHAVAHRAYHSIPPMNNGGQPLNAIYGFYSMLLGSIDTLKPDYLCVCLDLPGPTFRNVEFMGYRAKRAPTDSDLVSQLKILPETLADSNIPTFSMGGYEADDLIGTLSKKAFTIINSKSKKRKITKITIITGDKDLMQLVNNKVSLYMPIHGLSESKLFGKQEVKERLGVPPEQVIDLKALMGDMSDNYPGVSGVGPVVATNLLNEYQNLNNIYKNIQKIKPIVAQKLIKDKENAYMSQKLATIITNIPIKFKLKSLKFTQNNISALSELFIKFNFKSLYSRLNKISPQKQIKKIEVQSNQESLF